MYDLPTNPLTVRNLIRRKIEENRTIQSLNVAEMLRQQAIMELEETVEKHKTLNHMIEFLNEDDLYKNPVAFAIPGKSSFMQSFLHQEK
jgi:hypothetical protein